MEYSTSAPRRLPGIPLPGGADGCDSSSSHDSHDYREDASPVRTPYGGGVEGGYAPFDDDGDRSTEATPSKRARREEVPTPGPTPADLAGDRGRKSRPSSSKKKNPGQPDGVVISPTTLRLHEAAESLVASTPATAIERVESLAADSLGGIADALSWGGSRAGGSAAPGSSSDGADSLSGDSGDSSPDLPAFRSSASSAASSSLREGGEVVEQTAVLDMAADYLRRMEAQADVGGSPSSSSAEGESGAGESETVVADPGDDGPDAADGGSDSDGGRGVIDVGLADISGILRDVDDLLAGGDGDRPAPREDGGSGGGVVSTGSRCVFLDFLPGRVRRTGR